MLLPTGLTVNYLEVNGTKKGDFFGWGDGQTITVNYLERHISRSLFRLHSIRNIRSKASFHFF